MASHFQENRYLGNVRSNRRESAFAAPEIPGKTYSPHELSYEAKAPSARAVGAGGAMLLYEEGMKAFLLHKIVERQRDLDRNNVESQLPFNEPFTVVIKDLGEDSETVDVTSGHGPVMTADDGSTEVHFIRGKNWQSNGKTPDQVITTDPRGNIRKTPVAKDLPTAQTPNGEREKKTVIESEPGGFRGEKIIFDKPEKLPADTRYDKEYNRQTGKDTMLS